MAEKGMDRERLQALSAGFIYRMNTEWRERFGMFEREAIAYLLSVTVSRGVTSIKATVNDMLVGIKPKTNPHHWEGLPRMCGNIMAGIEDEAEREAQFKKYLDWIADTLMDLRRRKVITAEKATPNARPTIMVNLLWTPEHEDANQD